MDLTSIRAKGVQPLTSERAVLRGWELLFNVAHYFRHEGGVGNIRQTTRAGAQVQGVVHLCNDADLPGLDAVEAYGIGYDRITVRVESDHELLDAVVYTGMPGFIDDTCRPTQRYMNILLKGARNAGLPDDYISMLNNYPTHVKKARLPFVGPGDATKVFNEQSLGQYPGHTAIAGYVFDMNGARWQHEHLVDLFGGRDMTLWHLKRLDSSDGSETLDDIRHDKLRDGQRKYLNEYLHEYNREYTCVGRFEY